MPATVVIGAQWGDEGKGKVANLLAQGADVVVRYQGGNNAGHTIVIGSEKFALSLVPSGVIYPTVTPVIGNGCVVDPKVLLDEMATLRGRGIDPDNLRLSGNAHLIMPYHRKLDAVKERYLGRNQIGTTKRGIGPAYTDKYSRQGIRVQDLYDPGILASKLEDVLNEKNLILSRIYNTLPMDPEPIVEEYLGYAETLAPYVTDTSLLVWNAIKGNQTVVFEGAQGTLLDIDHGTYPFVTSSNPVAGGALTGAGIGPRDIDRVLGIAKAYITRVGTGPFPTELDDEIGERMVEIGGEFGTVTGRRRRCGWLDMVALRYAVRVGGITELAIMKLDVLSGFGSVRIATSYEAGGERYDDFPRQQRVLYGCTPIYEDHAGWDEDISGVRSLDDLPKAARDYLARIEELAGVPVSMVSVGPDREATFLPA
ncbi:MAG: adenylosuccinate synthase [Actinobacteria bacterium]|nr:adenylosuccinate synthase [Actinomycetota bacterium]MBU1494775.1 adenylosuccinate synthase [Actinomycetota bacterium]